jgi:predicted enzyme related to lactoylglutathione lyase
MEPEYQPGVPCWVDTLQPNVPRALEFYGQIFGWDFAGRNPVAGDAGGQYYVAHYRGRDVAGIGSQPPEGPSPPVWNTHIRVASADATARKVKGAGGKIVVAPFDVLPAGRMAVLADPTGGVFCAWEPAARHGAQLVNQPGSWSMSALTTGDVEGAQRFYGEVFGWRATSIGPIALWRLEGYVGGLPDQQMPRDVVAMMVPVTDELARRETASRWTVTFWVHDTDATAKEAARRGGKIITPPFDIPPFPNFRQAVLADPAETVFLVVARRDL